MVDTNSPSTVNRRRVLGAIASSGAAIATIGTTTGSERSSSRSQTSGPFTSCSSWEHRDPFCPASNDSSTTVTSGDDEVCWYEDECRYDGWYTKECCYHPPQLEQDSDQTIEWIVGGEYEVNLNTLFAQSSEWYAVDPVGGSSYWGVECIVHSGVTMVKADSGDDAYWLDEFDTTVSIGNAAADLYTYQNPNDANDWVGATEDLDQYQEYDVSDMAGETTSYLLGWVPYLGQGTATADYLGSMHNMLTDEPETGVSIDFSYDLDARPQFSPWIRFALKQMDAGQTETVEVTEGGRPGNWGTNCSLTMTAPYQEPNSFGSMTSSRLEHQGVRRVSAGDIRKNPSNYPIAPRSHLDDDTEIYLRK
ncbi:hypothetical protein [Halovivax cerinus]|uniref:Uncharacterized protein n=1 Tax=Halovivax cerinus TaxID=1487865 RepID=A0ABD5NQH3_9EURY|nr:hypothetical protein [Halovivax cerinus]